MNEHQLYELAKTGQKENLWLVRQYATTTELFNIMNRICQDLVSSLEKCPPFNDLKLLYSRDKAFTWGAIWAGIKIRLDAWALFDQRTFYGFCYVLEMASSSFEKTTQSFFSIEFHIHLNKVEKLFYLSEVNTKLPQTKYEFEITLLECIKKEFLK